MLTGVFGATLVVHLFSGGIGEAAGIALPVFWLVGLLSIWWWLPWLTLPLAAALVRRVLRESGPALNAVLVGTARLHLLFGLLLAASILLGR